VLPGDADGGRDLGGGTRPTDGERVPFGDARVARVQRELERLRARPSVTDRGAKVVEKRGRERVRSPD
jgi:hypothetical protein